MDSLWKIYNNQSKADTERLKAMDEISWSFRNNNPDTAIILAEQQKQLAIKAAAIKYELNALTTIGISYKNKGNYPKSLENYLKALKLVEQSGNKSRIGNCYVNIGAIYINQTNYPKALEYELKAMHLFEEIKETRGMGYCYGNIGNIYGAQSNYQKALEYFLKDLKIMEKTGDKIAIGVCTANIGNVYSGLANYPKAVEYYLKSLKIRAGIGDKRGMGTSYVNLAVVYNKLLNFKLAIQYSDSALQKTKETRNINDERLAYENLAIAYSKTNKYKEAYEAHVKFKQLTDSIFNEENSKQFGELKTQFEVDKKEAELKIKAEAKEVITAEEKKKQQIIIYAVIGVLLLVVVFSIFIFNRFRITNRQKNIIEQQKVLVDRAYESLNEKNKEIMDSIYYAKRIQRALITSEKYIGIQLKKLMKN